MVYLIQSGHSGNSVLDEIALIQRVKDGDVTAWEPLILIYQDQVFRLAYLLIGDPDEAADIAQETFVRAWRHLAKFDGSRPLRPWLLKIAANLARNQRRSVGRYLVALKRGFQEYPPIENDVESRSLIERQAADLWRAVQRLNPTDQQVIYLRFFLELSITETAQAMTIAEGTVKSRLNRALIKLRKTIDENDPAFFQGLAE